MNGAFEIGAMGMHAQQSALEIVASNITNMNTPAYKRAEARFVDMLAAPSMTGAAPGAGPGSSGMMMQSTAHIFTQGDLRPTGRELDIAVDGQGFIELLGGEGRVELWRGGSLKINADGFLAASNGLQLKSMISVPDGVQNIMISRDGIVSAITPGDTEPRELGRIELVRVRDLEQLESLGGGLYALPSDAQGLASIDPDQEDGVAIVQGSIEESNVLLTDEMVTLMMMQRSYAANAQVVQAGDQLMSIANGLRRG